MSQKNPSSGESLPVTERFDVLIVGAGIFSIGAAHHLGTPEASKSA